MKHHRAELDEQDGQHECFHAVIKCSRHKETRCHQTVTKESTHTSKDNTHSHGHAKPLQPLLLQLFGLEEELKAVLALVVSEVESIGPLQREERHTVETEINEVKGFRERQMEQEGAEAERDSM